MKRISIVILAVISLQFCVFFHKKDISEPLRLTIIPAWFEEMPESPAGIMLSVGYCGKYQDKSLARQAAIDHAQIIMAKQEQVRLKFELEEFADGRLRLLNPSFEQFYEESILNRIMQDYEVLDSLSTDDGYYVLLSYPSGDRLSKKSSGGKSWGHQPKWTKELPGSKNFVYGIGMVGKYSSRVRAWKDADEYARFDLGKNIRLEAESVHAVQRDDQYIIESKIIKQSYDMSLHNSVIVSRWYDSANNIYYSLCRMHKAISD